MTAIFYIEHENGHTEKTNICVFGSATFYKVLEKYIREYKRGYVKNENNEIIFKWRWYK